LVFGIDQNTLTTNFDTERESVYSKADRRTNYVFNESNNFQDFRNEDRYLTFLLENSNGINQQAKQMELQRKLTIMNASFGIAAGVGSIAAGGFNVMAGLNNLKNPDEDRLAAQNSVSGGTSTAVGAVGTIASNIGSILQSKNAIDMQLANLRDKNSGNISMASSGTEIGTYDVLDKEGWLGLTIQYFNIPDRYLQNIAMHYHMNGMSLGGLVDEPTK